MRIALIAHDNKKQEMVALAQSYTETLGRCSLCATGTTGRRIMEATGLHVACYLSGPLGGDQQIGSAIVNKEIDLVIFLRDPLTAHPHEPDVSALLRVCDVIGTPVATNLSTAQSLLNQLKSEHWIAKDDKPTGKQLSWNLKRTRYLFESQRFKLRQDIVQLPNEKGDSVWTYVEHPGGVFVVPVTKDRKILLLKMYRFTTDEWTWEVPAGGLGDKPQLQTIEVAKLELKEEAGAEAARYEDLGWRFCANGMTDKKLHYFIAWDTEVVSHSQHELGEHIEAPVPFSVDDVRKMVFDGTIRDGETVVALCLAFERLVD